MTIVKNSGNDMLITRKFNSVAGTNSKFAVTCSDILGNEQNLATNYSFTKQKCSKPNQKLWQLIKLNVTTLHN